MNDKRKALRKNLMAFTSVYGLQPKTLFGYIDDLTVLGVKVIGEKSVDVNEHFVLGIEFPQDANQKNGPRIVTAARVVWCRPDKNPHQWDIGFEFTESKPENEKIIEAILRRYEFRRKTSSADVD